MKLEIYEMKRQQLQQALQRLKVMAEEMQLESQAKQAQMAWENLGQEQFHMVVVGEFSRGKSTFVNALLGQKILPVSKNPTTAIISKIVYGDEPEFVLHYKDGKPPKAVSQEEFTGLKAPKEGLFNGIRDKLTKTRLFAEQEALDAIEFAAVRYPLAFCQNQVELVDTPGTNDLNTGRIEITYRYLDQADALILLLAADQALSESEAEFLRERILKKKIQDIFFVINRKDTLHGPSEEQQVIDFVSTNLKALLPKEMKSKLNIFLVSSKQALLYRRSEAGEELKPKQLLAKPDNLEITGFPELEDSIGRFLAEEKGQAKLQKYVRQGREILLAISETIQMRQEMLSHSADEIREQAEAMEPRFLAIKHETARIISNLRRKLEAGEGRLENSCIAAGDRLRQNAIAAVDNYTGAMNEKQLKAAVERAVTPEQKHWLEEMRKEQHDIVSEAVDTAQTALEKIWSDLSEVCDFSVKTTGANAALMKFSLEDVKEHKPSETETTAGTWCIGGALGLLLGAHVFLPALALGALGAGLLGLFRDSREDLREKAKQQIAVQYTEQAEKVKDNVLCSYKKQVNKVCKEIQEAIDGRIEDMRHQLQLVLAEKEKQELDADKETKMLMSRVDVLNECGNQLKAAAQ